METYGAFAYSWFIFENGMHPCKAQRPRLPGPRVVADMEVAEAGSWRLNSPEQAASAVSGDDCFQYLKYLSFC